MNEFANVVDGAEYKVGGSFKSKLSRYLSTHWIRCLLLALVGVIVRAPALPGALIWDDCYLARDNPFIKSPLFILEVFRHHLFLDSLSGHYRPVQNLSFMVDYLLWNTDTYGFHVSNILWHVGAGILLYFLLQHLLPIWCRFRMTDDLVIESNRRRMSLAATFIAFLWMVHPVHSAAIDYISGRADSLAFFFAAAGWLLVIRAGKISKRVLRYTCYALAAFSVLLALGSREIACIWMALFVLHTFLFEKKVAFRFKFLALVCCLCLLGIYAGLRNLPERRSGPAAEEGWPAPVRAVLMLRALGDYGRLMVFPGNLHMERTVFDPDNTRNDAGWRKSIACEYLSLLGLGVLAVLIAGAVRKGSGHPARIFGASWFLLAYLPISNMVQLNATAAEHWLYLPSVGFLIFLAGCVLDLPIRYQKWAATCACFAVVGLGVRSAVRSSDWVTEETFYKRTLAAGGASTRVAVNLGQIYANHHAYAEAEKVFRKVLVIQPEYPVARTNLADVLYSEGKKEEAEALLAAAKNASADTRKEFPRTWMAALSLARVRHTAHDDTAALEIIDRARKEYPSTWDIISFEAELVREAKGPDAALSLVENFARDNWWHYSAALALGRLYAEKGDTERAYASLKHASLLDFHEVQALNGIALMRARQNRLDDACRAQRSAVARQPDQPRQYILLSNILEQMGRPEEARATLAQVAQMRVDAHTQSAVN